MLAVTAQLSVRDVLQTIVASARRLLDARYAALGRARRRRRRSPSSSPTASATSSGRRSARCRASTALLGVMLREPEPVRLADIRAHPQFGWWPRRAPGADRLPRHADHATATRSSARSSWPTSAPGGFTADDEELLRLLAAHAAIALVNARLYERSRELSIVEERNRIARELHDAVTQKLFSLRLTAEAAAALVERDPARAAAELATVRRLAAEATEELRGDRGRAAPGRPRRRRAGRRAAQAGRAARPGARGARCGFARRAGAAAVAGQREEAVYRVAQEALHNALRHADAQPGRRAADGRRRDACRWRSPTTARGFEPTHGRPGRRLGLASMRERARAAGGRSRWRPRRAAARRCGWRCPRWLSRSGCWWSTTIRWSGRACARSSTCRTT